MTGVAQGVITGIRSLCYGLGPALFGFIFYLFHVDVEQSSVDPKPLPRNVSQQGNDVGILQQINEVLVSSACLHVHLSTCLFFAVPYNFTRVLEILYTHTALMAIFHVNLCYLVSLLIYTS